MERHKCDDCVRKHLAHATVLVHEARNGHSDHLWLAIAHMGEAVAECEDDRVAGIIEVERREYVALGLEYTGRGGNTDFEGLMEMLRKESEARKESDSE